MDAYSRMAGIQQQRYAANNELEARTGLGYANLRSDEMLRSRALGIQEAELNQRPSLQLAAIQERANLELQGWITQQRFTMADKQELTRQENALGELVSKRDSGEITEPEFFQMAGQVAPRVNSLIAKDKHNQVKAQIEQRQQQAELFKVQKDQRDALMAFQSQELDGKLDYHIPPKYELELSKIMKLGHPEMNPGTPEYDAMRKMEADKKGWAQRYAKKADGTPVYEKDVREVQPRGAVTEKDRSAIAQRAVDAAAKHLSETKSDYTSEELEAEARKRIDAIGKLAGGDEGKVRENLAVRHKEDLGKIDLSLEKLKESTSLTGNAKAHVVGILSQIKTLMESFNPGEHPDSVKARIKRLQNQFDQYNIDPVEKRSESKEGINAAIRGISGMLQQPDRIDRGLSTLQEIFSFHGAPIEGR